MKLSTRGKVTLKSEVLDITDRGLWILAGGEELFISFRSFPFFENATVKQIHRMVFSNGKYLHWPDLDVDIEVESIKSPDRYPLVFR